MTPLVLTISAARQRFFELFQTVTSRHGRKVIVTTRGEASHAVLVSESYLTELETAVRRLRDLEADQAPPADEFRLVGSGRIRADEDDLVEGIRAEARRSSEQKLVTFAKAR